MCLSPVPRNFFYWNWSFISSLCLPTLSSLSSPPLPSTFLLIPPNSTSTYLTYGLQGRIRILYIPNATSSFLSFHSSAKFFWADAIQLPPTTPCHHPRTLAPGSQSTSLHLLPSRRLPGYIDGLSNTPVEFLLQDSSVSPFLTSYSSDWRTRPHGYSLNFIQDLGLYLN